MYNKINCTPIIRGSVGKGREKEEIEKRELLAFIDSCESSDDSMGFQ
jgi:hypothetical protein